MVAIRKDVGLEWEVGAAGVHQVDARQAVLLGDLLGAEVLLDRQRKVRASLDRRIVGDDHALGSLDRPDPRDEPGAGCLALVAVPGGEGAQLEKGGVRIDQPFDPLPGEQLAARTMTLHGFRRPSGGDHPGAVTELGDELLHALPPRCELRARRVDSRLEDSQPATRARGASRESS